MNTEKNIITGVFRMELSDILPALRILEETGLESWKYTDFETDIQNNNPLLLVGKINSRVVGFCAARLITYYSTTSYTSFNNLAFSECEIYNIAVKREYQKQGIGSSLVDRLISLTKDNNTESIWLEVRSSNKQAISFYQKNDFEKMYERKNFYSKPPENAIVMRKNLRLRFFS
jgi:ribosomal-protein-alanine N-acetyltransferase